MTSNNIESFIRNAIIDNARNSSLCKEVESYANNLLKEAYSWAEYKVYGASGSYSASGSYGASGSCNASAHAQSYFQSNFRIDDSKTRYSISLSEYGLTGSVELRYNVTEFMTGGTLLDGIRFSGKYNMASGYIGATANGYTNGSCNASAYYNSDTVNASVSWSSNKGWGADISYNNDNITGSINYNSKEVSLSFTANF